MARQSRPQRWAQAASNAREAFDKMLEAQGELHEALATLTELKEEYQEWYDNMPEGLQGSATGEKLEELINWEFETEVDLDEYDELIGNAENADLPRGFGKD